MQPAANVFRFLVDQQKDTAATADLQTRDIPVYFLSFYDLAFNSYNILCDLGA